MKPRCQILIEYAKWTALSAVRMQCPVKAKEPVYQLLDRVAFSLVLDPSLGPIRCREFNRWHQRETEELSARAKHCLPPRWARELPIGWSAKLVNVFLKTTSYVGDLGREGLRDVLHPPLDTGLRTGLTQYFKENRPNMLSRVVAFKTISGIRDYAGYRRAIKGCCAAAKELRCSLIEVEQLASLGLRKGESPPGALVEAVCLAPSRVP